MEDAYAKDQLSKLNEKSDTLTIILSDFEGNQTKNLGMNSLEDIFALRKFIKKRLIFLRDEKGELKK